jgi:hypothetical protein
MQRYITISRTAARPSFKPLVSGPRIPLRHSTVGEGHAPWLESDKLLRLCAARGHFELVQLVLETAVMVDGPDKAKRLCIDHSNSKRQTALMAACKHGYVHHVGHEDGRSTLHAECLTFGRVPPSQASRLRRVPSHERSRPPHIRRAATQYMPAFCVSVRSQRVRAQAVGQSLSLPPAGARSHRQRRCMPLRPTDNRSCSCHDAWCMSERHYAGPCMQGRHLHVAHMPCADEDGTANIRFIDRHNGWGLTALHIAVFQGSVNTGA